MVAGRYFPLLNVLRLENSATLLKFEANNSLYIYCSPDYISPIILSHFIPVLSYHYFRLQPQQNDCG